MGKYEVAQAEYLDVMKVNPSRFQGANRPVEQVSWDDATNYCAQLSERERVAGRQLEQQRARLPVG
jgi:formylglycine-generating enzyme required for sulfatase activity